MEVRVGLEKRLNAEELMFLNEVLEKALESPLDYKEIQPVNPKGNNPEYSLEGLMLKLQYLATGCKEVTHWERP